jgi:hypothetical protein
MRRWTKLEDLRAILVTLDLKAPLAPMLLPRGNYSAVTLFESGTGAAETREFSFIIDCSGSMKGRRLQCAKGCLLVFIRSLPQGSCFNITRFGGRHESLFKESVEYNDSLSMRRMSTSPSVTC